MSATTYPKSDTAERAASLAYLAELLKPGDTVHTSVLHVARSGMSRHIKTYVVRDGNAQDITPYVADVIDYRVARSTGGLVVGGCGMDMCFHVVYTLSHKLFPKGFDCIAADVDGYKGYACPSNDHCNRVERSHHESGGYALNKKDL